MTPLTFQLHFQQHTELKINDVTKFAETEVECPD